MSLLLSKSILNRALISFWLAISFLGFSTAVYHPAFHEMLHAHMEHHAECDVHKNHTESEEHSDGTETPCHMCKVHNHIATDVSPSFRISGNIDSLSSAIYVGTTSSHLSHFSHSFSGRAPPVTF